MRRERNSGTSHCEKLADEGAQLALLGRHPDALHAIAERLPASTGGGSHVVIECDLSKQESIDNAMDTIHQRFNGIDVFISAAGAAQGGIFLELDDHAWRDNLEVKLFGTLRILRAVVKRMTESRCGRIVLVAGHSAEKPDPRMLPGAVANASLITIVRGLAEELKAQGVSINAVNPGPVRSSRLEYLMKAEAARSGLTPAQAKAAFLARSGLRELIEPDDVAAHVAFFSSSLSSHLTGTSITL